MLGNHSIFGGFSRYSVAPAGKDPLMPLISHLPEKNALSIHSLISRNNDKESDSMDCSRYRKLPSCRLSRMNKDNENQRRHLYLCWWKYDN